VKQKNEMPLHHKALAMEALSKIAVRMDIDGGWFVNQSVEMKERPDSSVLTSITGRGETPDEALFNHWQQLTELPAGAFLVIHAMHDGHRRHVRWNGYMWADLPLPTPEARP
jgi:hypothetical protein